MRLDGGGTRHVAFEDGDFYELEYGTWDGEAWNLSVIAAYPGEVSLGLHESTPFIAWHNWWDYQIWMARDGVPELVEADAGPLSQGTAIAVDDAGNPHVVWHSATNGGVFWAHHDGAAWTREQVGVTTNGGGYPSVLVDETTVYVAYADPTGLVLAARDIP